MSSLPLVKPTGFREYDARWWFGTTELNLMGVQALGLGLGTLLHEMGVHAASSSPATTTAPIPASSSRP